MGLAAVFTFLGRETLGATLFALFSLSWLSNALVFLVSGMTPPMGALGLFDLSLAAILILLAATAVLGKPLLAVVIALASVRFALNGIFELTANTGVQFAAGIVGLLIAAVALYAALAFAVEDVQHQTVLPLGRRDEAAEAFEGNLATQVGPIEQEAGVRKQL